jgi:hypothetical protein
LQYTGHQASDRCDEALAFESDWLRLCPCSIDSELATGVQDGVDQAPHMVSVPSVASDHAAGASWIKAPISMNPLTCTEVCKNHDRVCVENVWPTDAKFFKDPAIVKIMGGECSSISGGDVGAPQVDVNLCMLQYTGHQASDRCDEALAFESDWLRLCPCSIDSELATGVQEGMRAAPSDAPDPAAKVGLSNAANSTRASYMSSHALRGST